MDKLNNFYLGVAKYMLNDQLASFNTDVIAFFVVFNFPG